MNDEKIDSTVILVAETPDHEYTWVHIAGDVDPPAPAACATALDQLAACRCATLCVDLADVGSADTALLSFLIRVINRAPAGTQVLLCRPNQTTRRLLHLSFLDTITIVRDDLPFESVAEKVNGQRQAWIRPRVRRLAGIGAAR